jgi:hypothetical protein
MSVEYVLDRVRARLTIVGQDSIGEPEVVKWLGRQAVDGAWAYSTLVDLRLVVWNPTTEEIRRILHRIVTLSVTHGPRGPVAVVATQPALFGMAHMYAALSDQAVEAFYDFAEAERWLEDQRAPRTLNEPR